MACTHTRILHTRLGTRHCNPSLPISLSLPTPQPPHSHPTAPTHHTTCRHLSSCHLSLVTCYLSLAGVRLLHTFPDRYAFMLHAVNSLIEDSATALDQRLTDADTAAAADTPGVATGTAGRGGAGAVVGTGSRAGAGAGAVAGVPGSGYTSACGSVCGSPQRRPSRQSSTAYPVLLVHTQGSDGGEQFISAAAAVSVSQSQFQSQSQSSPSSPARALDGFTGTSTSAFAVAHCEEECPDPLDTLDPLDPTVYLYA
jgi:hypothetical protein